MEGVDQLVRRLNILPAEVSRENLLAATTAGAEVIRAAAALKAPRDKGGLAEGIVAEADPEASSATRATVLIGPDKDRYYGQFVELGHAVVMPGAKAATGNVPPRPFLRPALDESKAEVQAVIATALAAELGL